MGKILQPGYKKLFENIALFSLPLNAIFLFLQLEVITLDLDPENSFVKKEKFLFNRNNIVAFNKKKYQRPGQVALGAVFIKKTRSNPNFPLRPIHLFTDTAAILNSLDLRSIMGHEHDPIYSLSIYARFPGQFFFKFS